MVYWPFLYPITPEEIAEVISTRLNELYNLVVSEPFPTPTGGKEQRITVRKIIGNVHLKNLLLGKC